MKINYTYGYPNKNTFSIKPIKSFIKKYIFVGEKWIDPFVNNSIFKKNCYKTNDLNPDIIADFHLRSLDFLKLFNSLFVSK